MESSITKHHRNLSSAIHISTFSKYFMPFGNFIIPLILWISNKKESEFVDFNGKQALNFQISILLYSMIAGAVIFGFALFTAWDVLNFINISDHNRHHIDFDLNFNNDDPFSMTRSVILISIAGVLGLGLLALDVVSTIIATLRAKEGLEYKYPLSIPFIK